VERKVLPAPSVDFLFTPGFIAADLALNGTHPR
jgi:hypothetical protein